MSVQTWAVDDFEEEPLSSASPSPALVTTHFLLTALRRRWRVMVGASCAGLLLGLGSALAFPSTPTGTVTLILAHDPNADPDQALSTDVSLLRTRTLAVDVVERLGLEVTPEGFQSSVTSVPVSTDLLTLEVSGPDDAAAVTRTRALADAYLAFRAAQFRSKLEALTRGYEERLASMREEAADLDKQYEEMRTAGVGDEQQVSALLNEQAQVANRIQTTEQTIDDARLRIDSLIDASYVLDPARSKPLPSGLRTVVLAMLTGFVGAAAAGVGFVLLTALTSNRLRLREEVALALDTPVRVSVVGRLGRSRWLGRQPPPAGALALLVDALDREVSRPPELPPAGTGDESRGGTTRPFSPTHLALVTVDTQDVGSLVLASLAARLSAQGLNVLVVDLSEPGGLRSALDRTLKERADPPGRRPPVVHRPDRVPAIGHGPLDSPTTVTAGQPSPAPWPDAWNRADVTLALAEADPAVGVEHVRSWADEVVVLVTAGRSSAERLRTTGELIRAAALRLRFAMMVGTDRTDESLGLPEGRTPGPVLDQPSADARARVDAVRSARRQAATPRRPGSAAALEFQDDAEQTAHRPGDPRARAAGTARDEAQQQQAREAVERRMWAEVEQEAREAAERRVWAEVNRQSTEPCGHWHEQPSRVGFPVDRADGDQFGGGRAAGDRTAGLAQEPPRAVAQDDHLERPPVDDVDGPDEVERLGAEQPSPASNGRPRNVIGLRPSTASRPAPRHVRPRT